jgi:hypothetical protein
MRRVVAATVATVAALQVTPSVAFAEPMVLTATQMDSITAGARLPAINITVIVQNNITTQIANAIAISFANCGICIGRAPSASSFATAFNINGTGQLVRR